MRLLIAILISLQISSVAQANSRICVLNSGSEEITWVLFKEMSPS